MSYFVAISGKRASSVLPVRGKLVAAPATQHYFRDLAEQIGGAGALPVFLWDDGHSDTSDDLVCEACDEVQLEHKKAPDLAFASMLANCQQIGCALHVWWPSRLERIGGLSALPVVTSADEAVALFVAQASRGPIGFVLQPIRGVHTKTNSQSTNV